MRILIDSEKFVCLARFNVESDFREVSSNVGANVLRLEFRCRRLETEKNTSDDLQIIEYTSGILLSAI